MIKEDMQKFIDDLATLCDEYNALTKKLVALGARMVDKEKEAMEKEGDKLNFQAGLEFFVEHNEQVRKNTIFDFLGYVRDHQERISEVITFDTLHKIAKNIYDIDFITGDRPVIYTDSEGQEHEAVVIHRSANFRHYDIMFLDNGEREADVPVESLREIKFDKIR